MKKKYAPVPFAHILLFTSVFSLLAHGYRYLSMSFSGDSMLLSQVGEEAYQTSLGRFFQPLYWQIRGDITMPLVIGLFATAFLAASALIIVRLLRLKQPLHIALVCGILTANETMAVSNATYLPWTDVYALSLLLVLMGVYALFETRRGFLLAPVFYCIALGLYQSYLPAAATMTILILMLRVLDGENTAAVWKTGLLSIAALVAGLLLYAGLLHLILDYTGIQASNEYNGVANVGRISAKNLPKLIRQTYVTPLQLLFSLSGETAIKGHVTTVPQLLNIVLFALCALLMLLAAQPQRLFGFFTLAFLIAVLPLGINFVQFIARGIVSGLTIFSYNLLYLLPVALLERKNRRLRIPGALFGAFRLGAAACLCLFLALNIRTSNEMALKRDLEFSSTTAAMSRLLDRAERTQGYIPGETPVVLMGMLPSSSISMERPGFEELAQAQGMRYTYGASYETANYWYLTMALGEPINLVSHDDRRRLMWTEEAQKLPAFPDEGCCRMMDGHLYLRFH